MVLIGKVLNSDATINDYCEIGTLEFVPGSTFTLYFQIFKKRCDEELRYMAISNGGTITVTVDLAKNDGTDLSLTATQMTNDASIYSVSVTTTQSTDLAGGNIQFTVVDTGSPASTLKGWIRDGISKIVTGDLP